MRSVNAKQTLESAAKGGQRSGRRAGSSFAEARSFSISEHRTCYFGRVTSLGCMRTSSACVPQGAIAIPWTVSLRNSGQGAQELGRLSWLEMEEFENNRRARLGAGSLFSFDLYAAQMNFHKLNAAGFCAPRSSNKYCSYPRKSLVSNYDLPQNV